MNATEERVEAAIAKAGITDADETPKVVPETEEPKDTPKPDPKPEDKKEEVKSDDKPKYDKDGNRLEEGQKPDEAKPEDKKKTKEDDKEFTADDALELPADTPQAPPTDAAGIQLSTAEQKYVVDNIGDPLIIRGMRGIGDDAKEVELKVFDPTQIPRDFQFASQADLLAAQQGFGRLETKAQTLLGNFRNQQSQTQAADFDKRENEGIKQDVAELQKDGDFPKFKIQPGQKGFDADPGAVEMAKVMDIMTKQNNQYMAEYQQGRPYKHIGFKEAFATYQKTAKANGKVEEQKTEDTERKEIAKKIGNPAGYSAGKVMKPTIKPGTTPQDIIDRLDYGDF